MQLSRNLVKTSGGTHKPSRSVTVPRTDVASPASRDVSVRFQGAAGPASDTEAAVNAGIKGTPATFSQGYAAMREGKKLPLEPWGHEYGPLMPDEVDIKVTHNGICHTDIHMRDNDWYVSKFPFIPGHEVVGEVIATGSNVSTLKPGSRVGVGWIKNSCRRCAFCLKGEENICLKGYEGTIVMGNNGGFQSVLRVPADFAFGIPDGLDSASAAPLLCAGITVFSPLKAYVKRPGMSVAVLGVGGLGHLAVQFAAAMGANVTAIDTAADKEKECKSLGAKHFVAFNSDTPNQCKGQFDIILNTASGAVPTGPLLTMLKNDGVVVQIGIPGDNAQVVVPLTDLVFGQKKVVGSIVGGRSDMANMFEFAAQHGIKPMIEVLPSSKTNEAMDRVQSGKARYRVVLDMTKDDPNLVMRT